MRILITGVAGFIGFSLAKKLLQDKKNKVLGIDNLNDYYSVDLKKKRLAILKEEKNFSFKKLDILDINKINKFVKKDIDAVVHLAAQTGVRYSTSHPEKYIDNNIIGFLSMYKFLKKYKIKKFFFASSSSVYGDNIRFPLKESAALNPKNIYGFSKLTNETNSGFLCNLINTKFIGLRFFTVFGPWGRPDMLIFKTLKTFFKKNIFFLNNNGNHYRDFTYIEDVVNILVELIKKNNLKKFDIFNICSNKPIKIKNIINVIKKRFNSVEIINSKRNNAEVYKTHGDNSKILKIVNFNKFTNFNFALKETVNWYIKNQIYKY
jgi:UDP-glucuronate 4-epimerase